MRCGTPSNFRILFVVVLARNSRTALSPHVAPIMSRLGRRWLLLRRVLRLKFRELFLLRHFPQVLVPTLREIVHRAEDVMARPEDGLLDLHSRTFGT